MRKEFHRMIFLRIGLGDGPTIISDEDHDCFRKLTNQFDSECSPIFLPTLRYYIFKNNKICFENDYFLIHGLGKCE